MAFYWRVGNWEFPPLQVQLGPLAPSTPLAHLPLATSQGFMVWPVMHQTKQTVTSLFLQWRSRCTFLHKHKSIIKSQGIFNGSQSKEHEGEGEECESDKNVISLRLDVQLARFPSTNIFCAGTSCECCPSFQATMLSMLMHGHHFLFFFFKGRCYMCITDASNQH